MPMREGAGRRLAPNLAAAIALTVAACSGGAPESGPETASPSLLLERVARIGCGECDDARQITPMVIALRADGSLAVLDLYEPFVRLFGPEGDLLEAFGNKGQGPGELGLGTPINYLPGIWILDNELGGATVIDVFPADLEAFDADGGYVGKTSTGLPDAVPIGQAFDPHTRTYFRLSFSPAPGTSSRTISRCRFTAVGEADCGDFTNPERFLEEEGAPGALLGSLSLAATPDGFLVVANAGSYRIWVLDTAAETVVTAGRDLPLPAKSETEIARDRAVAASRGVEDANIAPHRQHIESYGIQVDGAARLWVLTGRYAEGNSVFDVFAPGGSFLAEVNVDAVVRRNPRGVTPFVVRGDTLAAVARQPDGNDEIWLYRIASR